MIEKINKILEKLPPEYKEPLREIVEILIQEQIEENRRHMDENFSRVWSAIEHLTYAVDNMRKSNEEEFKRIWSAIQELKDAIKQSNERIDRLEKAIEESNKRIDRLEKAIEESNKGIDRLEETTREEFNRVWQAISELTEAIKESNKRIDRLEESTREEFNRVWQSIDRLERAIEEMRKSNEEQFNRVWSAIEEMRRSNEEEFKRVWSAIQELKETVKGLIEAFEKSEKLNKETRKKLEALSDNFGYLLEDRAIRYLPKLLKDKFNAEVIEPIKRTYLKVNGSYLEVNIYGKIKIGDEEFILIGETKTRLSRKEIEKFISKCNKIEGKQFRILISYILQPQFEEIILNNNIKFIYSYEVEL